MVLIKVSLNFSRSSLVSESRMFFLEASIRETPGHVTHAITDS